MLARPPSKTRSFTASGGQSSSNRLSIIGVVCANSTLFDGDRLMPRLEHVSRSCLALALAALLAGPAAAYQVTTVSEGGTISGKVQFQGRGPTPEGVPTKGRENCGKNPGGAGGQVDSHKSGPGA